MYRIVWSLEEATLSKAGNKSAHIHKCRQKVWQCMREALWKGREERVVSSFSLGKQGIACSADLPESLHC